MNPFLQTDLFVKPAPDKRPLRMYQRETVDKAEAALLTHPSTLLVMATGLGKTRVAAQLAQNSPGRVLFCAHLDTLVSQSLAELQEMTGEPWEREQGPDRATRNGVTSVVASIATLMQPHRLTTFAPNAFARVIIDEAHHYLSKAYFDTLRYFADGGAKLIGLTATPDRKDGKAMGRLFASSACDPPLDIDFGVSEGFLTPIGWRPIEADVDLDIIPSLAGDLDQGQLDEAIARVIAPIIKVALEKIGDRRTIVFTPGVKAAHAAAEELNKIRPGCASSVDGSMDRDVKRGIIADHKAGKFQFLINCGVLVEGYDDAQVICMIDAAPTKSRSRAAQKVGRITRPWPGTATGETSDERREAIAASPKPLAEWIDLVFNGSKHNIVKPLEILGGSYTDKERAKAKKILEKSGGGDVKAALDAARKAIAAAAARARVRLNDKGLIDIHKKSKEKPAPPDPRGPPSAGQLRSLDNFGVPTAGLTHESANKLLRREWLAQKNEWCNFGERESMQRNIGVNAWAMKKSMAKKITRQWRWAGRPRPATVAQIAEWSGKSRPEPGYDG